MNANGLNGLDVHLGMHVGDTYIVDDDCLETLDRLLLKLCKDDPVTCPVRHYVLTSCILSAHVRHIVRYCLGNLDVVSRSVKLMLELSKPLDSYENAAANADIKEIHARLAAEMRALLRDGMAADLLSEVSGFVKQARHLHISEPCLELLRSLLQLLLNTLITSPVSELDVFCSDLLTQGLDELLFYAANSSQSVRLVVPAVGIMWFVYGSFEWHGGPISVHEAPATADERKKRLIVRMLELGLGNAVSALQEVMLEPQPWCSKAPDEKYFFWLIAFFLRQNQQVHVPLRCLKDVLSKECLGYLVYRSLEHWEHLMTTQATSQCHGTRSPQPKERLITVGGEKQILQVRLGLALSALTWVLAVIKEFGEMRLDDDSVAYLTSLIGQVVAMEDLREMLLLFVRCYSSDVMPLSFLVAVVRLNHRLLGLAECFMECYGSLQPQFDMMHHITQFASPRIMQIYSTLARRCSSNDRELNDGVFTMMDHVARDVGRVDTLLQSEAIGAFMRLNPTNALPENCELAEYVLQAFLSRLQSAPSSCERVCAELLLGRSRLSNLQLSPSTAAAEEEGASDYCATISKAEDLSVLRTAADSPTSWSEQERDDLFELYFKLKGEAAAAAAVTQAGVATAVAAAATNRAAEYERVAEALEQRGHARRSAADVAAQLLTDGLLDEDGDDGGEGMLVPQAVNVCVRSDAELRHTMPGAQETVEECLSALRETPSGVELLDWLSTQLSDVAYAKQLRERSASPCDDSSSGRSWAVVPRRLGMAAVAFYSVRRNVDTPLVTYSEAQEQAVAQRDSSFHRLLVALGLRMPGESLLFPRIPATWSAEEVVLRCRALATGVPSTGWTSQTGSPDLICGGEPAREQQIPEETLKRATASDNSGGQQELMDVTADYTGMTSLGKYSIVPPGVCATDSTAVNTSTAPNLWLLYMQPTNKQCK